MVTPKLFARVKYNIVSELSAWCQYLFSKRSQLDMLATPYQQKFSFLHEFPAMIERVVPSATLPFHSFVGQIFYR